MGPVPRSNGHAGRESVDEPAPGLAAERDDILGGLKRPGRKPVLAGVLPGVFERVRSDDWGGKGKTVIGAGTIRALDRRPPDLSKIATAWAPGSTAALISARWTAIASVSQWGMTKPAPLPILGQMAPKIWAESVRWSCGAEGRVPRVSQRPVRMFLARLWTPPRTTVRSRDRAGGPHAFPPARWEGPIDGADCRLVLSGVPKIDPRLERR